MFILFFSGADRIASAPISGSVLIGASILSLLALLRGRTQEHCAHRPNGPFGRSCLSGCRHRVHRVLYGPDAGLCRAAVLPSAYPAQDPGFGGALHDALARRGDYRGPDFRTVGRSRQDGVALRLRRRAAGHRSPHCGPMPVQIQEESAFLVGTVIAGVGFGLFQTPNNRVLLLTAPKARSGAAGAMQGTARLLGQTFGAISMSIIFRNHAGDKRA